MNTYSDPSTPAEDGGARAVECALPPRRGPVAQSGMTLLMAVVVFLAGGVCGAAVMRAAAGPKPLSSLDEIPTRISRRMQRELGLSSAQRAEIEDIIRAHQPELRRIRARILPKMRAEVHRTIDEIATVLTPDQAQRWRPTAQRSVDVHFPADDAPPADEPDRS